MLTSLQVFSIRLITSLRLETLQVGIEYTVADVAPPSF